MDNKKTTDLWYKEGLRFSCTSCGKCCCGSPGYVWVEEKEIYEIAAFLHISKEECMRTYIRQKGNRLALLEDQAHNYECVFLKDNKCLIYPVRPKQCQTFPWWKENLLSEAHWKEAARFCPGIHDEAELIPFEEISKNL